MAMGAVRVSMVLKAARGTWPPFGNAVVEAMACDPEPLLDPVEFRLFCDEMAELTGPLVTAVPVPPATTPVGPMDAAPVRMKRERRSTGWSWKSGFTSRITWY